MSDDLEIRGGGVIAVDTESLRAAADSWRRLALAADDIRRSLGSVPSVSNATAAAGLLSHGDEIEAEARRIGSMLSETAAVYEYVEASAAAEVARVHGNVALAESLSAQADALAAEDPSRAERAAFLVDQWRSGVHHDLLREWAWLPLLFGVVGVGAFVTVAGALSAVRGGGFGVPIGPRGNRVPAVSVEALGAPASASPVDSVASALKRIPDGEGDARIRVETYTMPDGSRQYVVYATGTRFGRGADEAFDMESNIDLYLEEQNAASSEAIRLALKDAGAQPGDVIHGVGHSQGAMALSHVAIASEYTFSSVTTIGNPIDAPLPPETRGITLRHTDDLVGAGLSGEGSPVTSGARGSFTAERVATPGPHFGDLATVHLVSNYVETAEMLDASPDPRMIAVRENYAELATASSVQTRDYSASRPTEPKR